MDYGEWAKEFFKELHWYEWIIFILFIALIVLVILALAGMEAAAALVAAIGKAVLFVLELLWVLLRGLFTVLRALIELLIDGLKALLAPLRGRLRWILAGLLEKFPWLKRLWDLVGGNAVWDLIKELGGWVRWLIVALINLILWLIGAGEAPSGLFKVPCGAQPMRTPAIRRNGTGTARDYPGGKGPAEIRQDAIDEAEKEAERSLREDLEKLASQFECDGPCRKSVTITITIIRPTPVKVSYYGLFDTYEATATAEGYLEIECR
ncbi:MAG: hypothetical protein ACJ8J7_02875 [Sulfurifustaceae bacterium]